jgi:hypothetical protein
LGVNTIVWVKVNNCLAAAPLQYIFVILPVVAQQLPGKSFEEGEVKVWKNKNYPTIVFLTGCKPW